MADKSEISSRFSNEENFLYYVSGILYLGKGMSRLEAMGDAME